MKINPIESLSVPCHTFYMPKRPRDTNQLAKYIVDLSIGEIEDDVSDDKKNPTAKGRQGGLKGGYARADKLSAEQRSAIAKKAADARWKQK